MPSVPTGRKRCHRCWYVLCAASLFLGGYDAPQAQAKLGDTLPQLIKRFGKEYTEEGMEEDGTLEYKFRSPIYSVDAMMTRHGDKLVSNVEVYYSDKPLQANGDPPASTVRGIMSVIAPGAKWHEVPRVGTQQTAFMTADGVYLLAILPPDKTVDTSATFTVVVGKAGDVNGVQVTGRQVLEPGGHAGGQTAAPSPSEGRSQDAGGDSQPQASDPLAVTLPTGKIVHFKTMEEKANFEAAMGVNAVQSSPAVDTAPQPLLVVGHFTRGGVEMLRLSDGTVAIRAQLELNAYENNEIAADQSFKGQRQPIFGTISSFGVDILGYPYLVLDQSATGITGVQCTFGKEEASTLATLQKGQIVAVTGKHNGKLFNVQLSECALISWKKFDYNAPEVRSATAVPTKSR